MKKRLKIAAMLVFCIITAISEAVFGLCLGDILDAIDKSSMELLVTLLVFLCVLIAVSISTAILARIFMFKNASDSVA